MLASFGLAAVGVDASRFMVEAAARRTGVSVVQGDGAALPFRSGAFGGAWIERVLMHVDDPASGGAEMAKVLWVATVAR